MRSRLTPTLISPAILEGLLGGVLEGAFAVVGLGAGLRGRRPEFGLQGPRPAGALERVAVELEPHLQGTSHERPHVSNFPFLPSIVLLFFIYYY